MLAASRKILRHWRPTPTRLSQRWVQLNLVVVWREAPLFSARERAALAWTEALTRVAEGVSDEVYAQASAEFSERELADLSSAIASINVWNRLGVAYRRTPAGAAGGCCGGVIKINSRCLPGCQDGAHRPATHGRRQARRRIPVRFRARVRGSNAHRPRVA
jgi:hypothetical protein